jgi:hypothetical protein
MVGRHAREHDSPEARADAQILDKSEARKLLARATPRIAVVKILPVPCVCQHHQPRTRNRGVLTHIATGTPICSSAARARGRRTSEGELTHWAGPPPDHLRRRGRARAHRRRSWGAPRGRLGRGRVACRRERHARERIFRGRGGHWILCGCSCWGRWDGAASERRMRWSVVVVVGSTRRKCACFFYSRGRGLPNLIRQAFASTVCTCFVLLVSWASSLRRLSLCFSPNFDLTMSDLPCLIPSDPDISGIGVRIAIYVQNLLSFVPAVWAILNNGQVSEAELEYVKAQSMTILITAFAILVTAIVEAQKSGLSNYHASVVLSLS